MSIHGIGRVAFQQDQAIELSKIKLMSKRTHQITHKLERKKTGFRAVARQREKRRTFKPFIPIVLDGKHEAASLPLHEHKALTRTV